MRKIFQKVLITTLLTGMVGGITACVNTQTPPEGEEVKKLVAVETTRVNEYELPQFKRVQVESVKVGDTEVEFSQSGATIKVTANGLEVGVDTTLVVQGGTTVYETPCVVATMAIDSVDDFKKLREGIHAVTDYYVMTSDVDFFGVKEYEYAKDDVAYTFKGTFDGRGYTVKDFFIDWTKGFSGLLGSYVEGSEALGLYSVVKNFAMTGVRHGGNGTGAIASELRAYSKIEDVYVEGNLTRGGVDNTLRSSGYLVGMACAGSSFKNCVVVDNTPPQQFRGENLGLFVGCAKADENGENYPTFYNCYAASESGRPLVRYYDYQTEQQEFMGGTKLNPYNKLSTMYTEVLDNPAKADKFVYFKKTNDGIFWGTAKIGE